MTYETEVTKDELKRMAENGNYSADELNHIAKMNNENIKFKKTDTGKVTLEGHK
jgi:uncharacterized membrane protein YcaP (DUF421 family)